MDGRGRFSTMALISGDRARSSAERTGAAAVVAGTLAASLAIAARCSVDGPSGGEVTWR